MTAPIRRILVTGAAGNVGRVVRERLDADPALDAHYVVSTRHTGELDAVTHAVDITDAAAMRSLLETVRPDAVIHLASLVGQACQLDPELATAVNVTAVQQLANAARAVGVRRIVLASTSAVYGDAYRSPISEDGPVDLSSVYARSKWDAERVLDSAEGIETVALRIFNVYGPSMASSLVTRLMESTEDARVQLAGLDDFVRDYVHVDDVARALVAAATAELSSPHLTVNIGSGVALSNREIVAAISARHDIHFDVGTTISSYSCANIERAGQVLNFVPEHFPGG